jgi:hypothetical protein
MRQLVVASLLISIAFASSTVRADQWDGCVVGPMDSYNRCTLSGSPAAVLGAVAAPFLVAGAVVTIADELTRHHQELAAGTVVPPGKKPSLSYVPPAPEDPYRNGHEHAVAANPAFDFNDKATTVATAITAAAVLGAIIGTIAADAGKRPAAGKR